MMDFFELVAGRESIRSYDPQRPLSHDVLVQLLEAGRLAPSAANLQPWRFIVVSSAAKLAGLRNAYKRPWFADAPHVLVIVGNKEQSWKRGDGYNSIETDLAIATYPSGEIHIVSQI
jgi:nitroreductase